MVIWRVSVDPSSDTLTIKSLRSHLRRHLREKFRADLDAELRQVNYKKEARAIEGRIDKLRNTYLAHLDSSARFPPSTEDARRTAVYLSDLRTMALKLEQFYDVLCLGHGRDIHILDYHPKIEYPLPHQTDIEDLLDLVARNSAIVNMPELQAGFWPHHRQSLATEDLQLINRYRVRFKLPEV